MVRNWKPAFLAALIETGSVTRAAEIVGMGRSNVYQHKRNDPVFAVQWEEALEVAADVLEDEARRRAYEGWDEPVFQKGEQVGVIRKYDSTLLIFLLKAIKPHKYRESRASIPPSELLRMLEEEIALKAKQKAATENASQVM